MSAKKVLITGASRGIGKAIAKAFAKEGYDLYLTCSKSIEELNNLADNLRTSCMSANTSYESAQQSPQRRS